MIKSVEEWLYYLPEPYRTKALRHHSFYNKLGNANCMANALVLAFKWTSSSEGGTYWREVHEMCVYGKFQKEQTTKIYKKTKGNKAIKAKFISDKKVVSTTKENTVPAAKVYPNIDCALEEMYRPFSERKKQIDKL